LNLLRGALFRGSSPLPISPASEASALLTFADDCSPEKRSGDEEQANQQIGDYQTGFDFGSPGATADDGL
jgi:hypothetical protein